MRKAKIYIPTKTAMQSGLGNKLWILEFETRDTNVSPLMGWESSDDTLAEIKLEFSSKDKAIEYAKNNSIDCICAVRTQTCYLVVAIKIPSQSLPGGCSS